MCPISTHGSELCELHYEHHSMVPVESTDSNGKRSLVCLKYNSYNSTHKPLSSIRKQSH